MDSINVHDLPEEDAELIAAFVEFLRARRRQQASHEVSPAHVSGESPFARWPLGVQGTLGREEIYDYLG